MTAPVATYRVQFRNGMDFARAEGLVAYLKRLGISHLYASPVFSAVTGSTHGYDVVDCNAIDPVLGGQAGLERLSRSLHEAGLGLILDIVPNHMAASLENRWWRSVVEWGEQSPFARHFDIDWSRELTLPLLGKPFSDCVAAGEILLDVDEEEGCAVLRYFDQRFPLHPASYEAIFTQVDAPLGEAISRRAAEASPDDEGAFHDQVRQLLASGDVGELPAAMERQSQRADFLAWIHDEQPYRLMFWKEARRNLSYRRFFEVTGLVGLRVEDEAVFDDAHRLVLDLVRTGIVDGLRIDHVDGLADPGAYLDRLRRAAGADIPILVEKILEAGEELPAAWPIQGTTGYECIAAIAGLLTDPAGLERLGKGYAAFVGGQPDLEAERRAAKLEMLRHNFEGEVTRLTNLAAEALAQQEDGDVQQDGIKAALIALGAAFPVYRTYGDFAGMGADDAALVDRVARKAAEDADPRALAAIASLLKGKGDSGQSGTAGEFRVRFEQLTGPVMAKAVEDTLFYRYNRLIGLNEVGGDPRLPADGIASFHASMRQRVAQQPFGLSASATHDTKRGEDGRARLYALSEYAEEWVEAVERWREMMPAGDVDAETRWLILQALAGVWPQELAAGDRDGLARLRKRFLPYLEKALREAKRHTSWTEPDKAYEKAALDHASALLAPGSAFLTDFVRSLQPIMRAGQVTSLAQTLVKLTMPGIPDIYQGSEGRDLSLVDPDNRRVPDFAVLEQRLDGQRQPGLETPFMLKQQMIAACLACRAANPLLFAAGDYTPVPVDGVEGDALIAFQRTDGAASALVVVPRQVRGLLDRDGGYEVATLKDRNLLLPPSLRHMKLRNIVTGGVLETGESLPFGQALAELPFALLVNDVVREGAANADSRYFVRQAWAAGEASGQQRQEKTMDSDRRKEIERRAYELWEQEGRPAGREQVHWDEAEREFADTSSRDPSEPYPSQQEDSPFLTGEPSATPEKKKRAPAKPRVKK